MNKLPVRNGRNTLGSSNTSPFAFINLDTTYSIRVHCTVPESWIAVNSVHLPECCTAEVSLDSPHTTHEKISEQSPTSD